MSFSAISRQFIKKRYRDNFERKSKRQNEKTALLYSIHILDKHNLRIFKANCYNA